MNVVGRVRSLISQGVYSVATPFHPFGGAVDVIVVQQQDGSFRSTPWYVRFGKFQGVLKGTEKIVRINVNDIEANFHMYLDNSGEAFFLNEVVPGKDSLSNGNIMDSDRSEVMREDSGIIEDSYIGSNETSVSLCRYESSVSDPGVMQLRQESTSSYVSQFVRAESDGERRFYEFQEEQSSIEASVELAEYEKNHLDRVEDYVEQQASDSEVVLFSVDGHVLTAPISATETETDTENVQLSTPQFHLGPGEGTEFVEGSGEFGTGEDAWAANYISDLDASPGKVAAEDACSIKRSSKENTDHSEVCGTEGEQVFQAQETQEISNKKIDIPGNIEHASASFRGEEHFMRCLELLELATNVEKAEPQSRMEVLKKVIELPEKPDCNVRSMCETEEECVTEIRTDGESPHCSSDSPGLGRMRSSDLCVEVESVERDEEALERFDVQSNANELEWKDAQGIVPEVQEAQCSPQKLKMEDECYQGETTELPIISSSKGVQTDSSIKFEISLCRNELQNGMGEQKAAEVFNSHIVSEEKFKLSAASIMKDDNLVIRYKGKYFSWDKAAPLVFGMAAFGLELPIDTEDAIPVEYDEAAKTGENRPVLTPASSGQRWRLWPNPFRRVKTLEQISSNASNEEVFVDTESATQSSVVEPEATSQDGNVSPHKQFKRTKIPTSEQIASLNLQEGQNIVTFSFSTRVLGTQQVDAHIYLWKWNARIVISDVDGTITKSDVLGQFMPLVGKDWTQSGVARLFCAIKENGYQLLFLSARAIVQAYLTRSFLLNLKQDGKTLPNGPIVISPDGLFPSLYREVIRRAPHEFKIACLEDIKALFPSDYNPFYAGFGNRDTDELSYLKIGIPKGKIFIINPKGEVAISHRIDVKSYTSLHTLVNDMFPPTSLIEQEDFNSWNFWKMPIPDVE